jgi:hypothetical protein
MTVHVAKECNYSFVTLDRMSDHEKQQNET